MLSVPNPRDAWTSGGSIGTDRAARIEQHGSIGMD
jgi:hypothetical protein